MSANVSAVAFVAHPRLELSTVRWQEGLEKPRTKHRGLPMSPVGLTRSPLECVTPPSDRRPWTKSTTCFSRRNGGDIELRSGGRLKTRAIPFFGSAKSFLITVGLVVLLILCVQYAVHNSPAVFSPGQGAESRVIGHGKGAMNKQGKNREWASLNENERKAATFLGFDAESWDTDNKVYIDRLTWDELSSAQKQAAKELSFRKSSWNEDMFVETYERSWNELTQEQKSAAKELGYKRSTWDRDSPVWSDDKRWSQLNERQQASAVILGYTELEWNDTRRVYEKSWDQLNQVQRIAAEELGYNKKSWDRDRSTPPPSHTHHC